MPTTDEILVVLFIKPLVRLMIKPLNKLVIVIQITFVKTCFPDLGIRLDFLLF